MGLQSYVAILRRRWILVFCIILACVDVAAVVTLTAVPQYLARAGVFVTVEVGTTPGQLARATGYAQYVARTYAEVATTPLVLDPVIRELDRDLTIDELTDKVVARVVVRTVMVEIAVTDSSPPRAAAIANAVATRLPIVAAGLDPATGSRVKPALALTISPATAPTFPVSPRKTTNLMVGLLLGGLAGVIAAVALDSRKPLVDSRQAVARLTSAPVLGSLRGRHRRWVPRPTLRPRDDARTAAQLPAAFSRLRKEGCLRTVVLTSAVEGAATWAAAYELAMATARAGSEVLLVDADLHRPAFSGGLSVGGGHGLSCALTGERRWSEVVMWLRGIKLSVLPAGPPLPDPAALLGSDRMAQLLAEAASLYELVLLKAPPVLRVAEGLALSRLADAVVVVADETGMPWSRLSDEVAALGNVGARLAGVVLVS